ncbi:hypothetical protein GCM10008901_16110 [Bifidobacterium pullorum]
MPFDGAASVAAYAAAGGPKHNASAATIPKATAIGLRNLDVIDLPFDNPSLPWVISEPATDRLRRWANPDDVVERFRIRACCG